MASTVPDLPLWAWNLIIAIQRHEDLHAKDDTCLTGVLNAVPADVRLQAEAISAYVQKASGNEFGKRISENLSTLAGSLFNGQPTSAGVPEAEHEGEAP